MTRTRAAFLCGLVCDAVLLLGAAPLVQHTMAAAHSPQSTIPQLLLLLCANVALLGVCLCGAAAWMYAAARLGRSGLRALTVALASRAKHFPNVLREEPR